MLKKVEVLDLCKKIALDYDGWEFTAGAFKNKQLKHTIKIINPLWSFSPGSALAQPIAGISNKKIDKIYTQIVSKPSWTHRVNHKHFYDGYVAGVRIYDLIADDAEGRVRRMFDEGLELLENTYDFSSEKALLESIPFEVEQVSGVINCIIQCCLGNFDFVRLYHNEEIETEYPKDLEDVQKAMEYFDI